MTRILLTGGSGFIAAHVLELLLKEGHSVVTTVRSQSKADNIKKAHPEAGDKLSFAIVEDIAVEGAFDKAVVSDPPFEAVIHTASPFFFNVTDVQKQLLDPALIGTTGILKAIKAYAPTVQRVVITSSFAAIINQHAIGLNVGHTYTEADWNPLTHADALSNPSAGYRASKTFAERAAWEFVEKEKPNFDIATINPPLVFGPVVHYLNSLDSINTSNERARDLIQGKWKEKVPNTGVYLFVDVRDVAAAHVKAAQLKEAGGKRFFATAGYFSNSEVVEIVRKNFPEYKGVTPENGSEATKEGARPKEIYGYDNSRSKDVLGLKYMSLEETVVDTIRSLKEVGV